MNLPNANHIAPEAEVLSLEPQGVIAGSGEVTTDNPFSNDTETYW